MTTRKPEQPVRYNVSGTISASDMREVLCILSEFFAEEYFRSVEEGVSTFGRSQLPQGCELKLERVDG